VLATARQPMPMVSAHARGRNLDDLGHGWLISQGADDRGELAGDLPWVWTVPRRTLSASDDRVRVYGIPSRYPCLPSPGCLDRSQSASGTKIAADLQAGLDALVWLAPRADAVGSHQ